MKRSAEEDIEEVQHVAKKTKVAKKATKSKRKQNRKKKASKKKRKNESKSEQENKKRKKSKKQKEDVVMEEFEESNDDITPQAEISMKEDFCKSSVILEPSRLEVNDASPVCADIDEIRTFNNTEEHSQPAADEIEGVERSAAPQLIASRAHNPPPKLNMYLSPKASRPQRSAFLTPEFRLRQMEEEQKSETRFQRYWRMFYLEKDVIRASVFILCTHAIMLVDPELTLFNFGLDKAYPDTMVASVFNDVNICFIFMAIVYAHTLDRLKHWTCYVDPVKADNPDDEIQRSFLVHRMFRMLFSLTVLGISGTIYLSPGDESNFTLVSRTGLLFNASLVAEFGYNFLNTESDRTLAYLPCMRSYSLITLYTVLSWLNSSVMVDMFTFVLATYIACVQVVLFASMIFTKESFKTVMEQEIFFDLSALFFAVFVGLPHAEVQALNFDSISQFFINLPQYIVG